MVKLYDISSDYNKLENMVASGDISDEQVKDTLDMVEGEFNDKALNVLHVSNSLDTDLKILSDEIKRLQEKKKVISNNKDRLRNYLKTNMEISGINKISSPVVTITLKKASEQLHIFDERLIPDEYLEVFSEVRPKKRDILNALKAGEDIEGCVLVEGSRSLLIK